jgi:phosphoglycerate dehydrogenase-like enzyme
VKIAVIDDWQRAARDCADWGPVEERAELVFFPQALEATDGIVDTLRDFDGVVAMRDRTVFGRDVLQRLPRLQVIAQTGVLTNHIDLDACAEFGVTVLGASRGSSNRAATPELCLGLMLAASHHIVRGSDNLRSGLWQDDVPLGEPLNGKVLGLFGLGEVGGRVAAYGRALGMRVLAWSPHLTPGRAAEHGAESVPREELLRRCDVLSLHLVASAATARIVGRADFALLRDGAVFVNTARAALVDQAAMLDAIATGRITAALDVFDEEPLPRDHPLRRAPNVVLTPHLGFVKRDTFEALYGGIAEQLARWLAGEPATVLGGAPQSPPG